MLEQHWAELRAQAYVVSTPAGWKIFHTKEDGLFSRLGFRHEQFIPADALLYFAKAPGKTDLVERILAIFEHISKPGTKPA